MLLQRARQRPPEDDVRSVLGAANVLDRGERADDAEEHGEQLSMAKPDSAAEGEHRTQGDRCVQRQCHSQREGAWKRKELEPDERHVQGHRGPVRRPARIANAWPVHVHASALQQIRQRVPRVDPLVNVPDGSREIGERQQEIDPEQRHPDVQRGVGRPSHAARDRQPKGSHDADTQSDNRQSPQSSPRSAGEQFPAIPIRRRQG